MKKILLLVIVWAISLDGICAQKEGNVWVFGGFTGVDSILKTCHLDFNESPPAVQYYHVDLPFIRTNTTVCNREGELICASNGEIAYNRNHAPMVNGSNLVPSGPNPSGYPAIQSFFVLPRPGHSDQIIHFSPDAKIIYVNDIPYAKMKLIYSIADMTLVNGLGAFTELHRVASEDTLEIGQITATRHGNGRDWWIVASHFKDPVFYTWLLTPDTVYRYAESHIAGVRFGLGQAVFSPDGNWLAKFNAHGILPDSTYSTIELYRFDRCAGTLSDYQYRTYDLPLNGGRPGGVAFSASSRYMYVSRWDTIYQYDMQAPDIISSETVVAAYDGFRAPDSLPTRFYSLMLGPDRKIYGCVSNYNSQFLHVIHAPDSAGTACMVEQHAIMLPVYNYFAMPNNPWYDLWDASGSPCDTLGIDGAPISGLGMPLDAAPARTRRIQPNPASERLQVKVQDETGIAEIRIYSISSSLALRRRMRLEWEEEISIGSLPAGLYFVEIESASGQISRHKLMIQH